MRPDLERNLGEQPIAALMLEFAVSAQDLVAASTAQLTHKMVARACKGRRLTGNARAKLLAAMQAVTGKELSQKQLFNY